MATGCTIGAGYGQPYPGLIMAKKTNTKATKATKAKLLATTANKATATKPKATGKGVDKYGFAVGSSRAWVAENCYGKPGGATTAQVVAALDKVVPKLFPKSYPHLNMLTWLEKNSKAWTKGTTMVAGPSGRIVTAYAIVARD